MKPKKYLLISLIVAVCLSLFPNYEQLANGASGTEFVSPAKIPNFIYLYGGSTNTYIKQIESTYQQIKTVSPNYFNLTKDGNLDVEVDRSFVKYAQENNIKILPFVSNHFNRELGAKAMANREKLAAQIADAVLKYDLDGVSIDIENLSEKQRDMQTEFLRLLADKLQPRGKKVSIAVAAANKDAATGWFASYDYEAIGQIVDSVFVMAYDQHYEGGTAGPVAGYPWVKSVLDYLTAKIPREKIILGLPFYGRYWSNQQQGRGISYAGVQNLIEQNNAEVKWDNYQQVPYANFYDKQTNQRYEIWFENQYSLGKKLSLVEEYGLSGWGAWRLGQEDETFWKLIQNAGWADLAGQTPVFAYFTDVYNHWAKNAIEAMMKQGLISGYPNNTFRPDQYLSREELAAIMERMMKLEDTEVDPKQASSLKDVASSRWSYPIIQKIRLYGFMQGYPDDTFRPANNLTRAELAAVLARGFNIETIRDAVPFADINGHWAAAAIGELQKAEVLGGYKDGTFRPDQPVTRAEAAAMLQRIISNPDNYARVSTAN